LQSVWPFLEIARSPALGEKPLAPAAAGAHPQRDKIKTGVYRCATAPIRHDYFRHVFCLQLRFHKKSSINSMTQITNLLRRVSHLELPQPMFSRAIFGKKLIHEMTIGFKRRVSSLMGFGQ